MSCVLFCVLWAKGALHASVSCVTCCGLCSGGGVAYTRLLLCTVLRRQGRLRKSFLCMCMCVFCV